jgi:hypothetical protein
MRFVDDQVFEVLARLNVELAERGDPARVRYVAIQPDPDLDDMWLVIPTFELPDLPPGRNGWPLDDLRSYSRLAWDWLNQELMVSVYCQYRTHKELAADPHLGRSVPELV